MLVPDGARDGDGEDPLDAVSRGTGVGRKARIEWREMIAVLDVEDG